MKRVLSKTLTCKFKGQLLVLITRPEQPRYALRAQTVQVIEHQGGDIELLWGTEALPFNSFDAHQHLNQARVAADKLLNARVDEVLVKEAARLRKLQVSVAMHNQGETPRSRLSA